MSVTVRLNLTRLRRALQGTPQAIDRGARAYADAVLDLAVQLAPYETGELRDSGEVVAGDRPGAYQVVFRAPYAVFVEYGARAPAQPFLTPALRHIDPLPFFARELAQMSHR